MNGNHITRFDPKTKEFVEYPIPTPDASPRFISIDPMGRVWFGEFFAGKIGVVDPDGQRRRSGFGEIDPLLSDRTFFWVRSGKLAPDEEAMSITSNTKENLMRHAKYTWGICLLLLLLFAGAVSAQVTTGIISGVVQDSSGGVVPHAMVTVRQTATALNRSTETDGEGRYRISELPLGEYEVEVSLSGFATETQKGVTLTVGREAVVNVGLKVGTSAESVSVTAEAPLVETTNASVAYLVDDQKIRDLPLNGRSYTQLALLQPGVVASGFVRQDASTGKGTQMSISGAQTNQNVFLLDGQSINDANGLTPGSAAGTNLGVDAIQEFNVITTNYNAEFGLDIGGVINVVTRSGTNDFHGSAFEFLRNSALDAKNYFDLAQAPIPPFKRNQFGATIRRPNYQR